MKLLRQLIVPVSVIVCTAVSVYLTLDNSDLRRRNARLMDMVYDKYPVEYEGARAHYITLANDSGYVDPPHEGSTLRGFDRDGEMMFAIAITGPEHRQVFRGLKGQVVK